MDKIEMDNDLDKIFGMNRIMFFVIVSLVCILSISVGIYATFFYKYSKSDPFIIGTGIKQTEKDKIILELRNNFSTSFKNSIIGSTTAQDVKRLDKAVDKLVTTTKTISRKEDNYSISVNIPKINLSSSYTDRINAQISRDFSDKADNIMDASGQFHEYSVNYMAYLNGHLLSLIINETEKEGSEVQTTKIYTYNINLNTNSQVQIADVMRVKGYTNKDLQELIDEELKELNKKDEELKKTFPDKNIELRNTSDNMYKAENANNFIVDNNGYLYIIYAYGNNSKTTKMDVLIFE